MPVTRRQLQLAKANNEDERVAKFEEFYHFDVEKAEKLKAIPKKTVPEKSESTNVFSSHGGTTESLVMDQSQAQFLGDNEESFAVPSLYPDFRLTEIHESPDEAPRDRSMILSPADSGIGENPEMATSSSDLSLYADEFHRRNDNLRNSIDAENTDETVDIITDMANEIQDCKTEPVWSDDEYQVSADKSLSYGEKIEDYQRFKHRKELTQLMNVNSAAFMGLMKTTFEMTKTEVSKTPRALESVGPITTRKRAAPRVAKAPKGQKSKRVPAGHFPAKLKSLAEDENVPSVKLTAEGAGFIFFTDRFEQDYLQVASKQDKQPINTKKWPSFQRNLNNYGYKQHNFKDTKSKKTGFKMFFRPDELLKAYQDGHKTHNYKIAKTPQIKKEYTKERTCDALAIQNPEPVPQLPSPQSILAPKNYPQVPFYSQMMHPYPPAFYDHQLTGFPMLPHCSTFRPEEQKPTFDDNNDLSIMELHTIPDLEPIPNLCQLNHL